MKNTGRTTILITLAAIASNSYGSITSYTAAAHAEVDHYYAYFNGSGSVVYDSASDNFPMNFSLPTTDTTIGGDLMESSLSFKSALTASSSTYLQLDGSVAEHSHTSTADGVNFSNSFVIGDQSLTFNLDTPGVVTLTESNSVFSSQGGTSNETLLYLDGTFYQFSGAPDNTYSIAVGAGHHYALTRGNIQTYSGEDGNGASSSECDLSADYQITVTTTPEPCTFLLIPAFVLGLRRRRAHR